jgi:hypothetical protein
LVTEGSGGSGLSLRSDNLDSSVNFTEALQAAGATEEMIAAAVKAGGDYGESPRSKGGRPRLYADRAARDRFYRAQRKQRVETRVETPPRVETRVETPNEIQVARVEMRDEIPRLRARLEEAGQGNFDAESDIAPIRALLDQGCDLEADVVPVVARLIPELPRPLKNWGAPWLVRDILAARDQRLAGHRVEAVPPARRTPAIEWDEFVEERA